MDEDRKVKKCGKSKGLRLPLLLSRLVRDVRTPAKPSFPPSEQARLANHSGALALHVTHNTCPLCGNRMFF